MSKFHKLTLHLSNLPLLTFLCAACIELQNQDVKSISSLFSPVILFVCSKTLIGKSVKIVSGLPPLY